MSVALSIVFSGLCALVTDGRQGEGQVILVDSRGIGEEGGVVLPDHAPTLVASLRDVANAATSRPTHVVLTGSGPGAVGSDGGPVDGAVDQIGIWDLSGSEVRVRVPGRRPSDLQLFLPAAGASSWPQPPRDPNDAGSWRDIRYVPSMAALAGEARVRSSLLAPAGDAPAGLPRGVAARLVLDGGRVEAGMPSQEQYRGEVFEFRGARGEPRLRQALTDTIRWSVDSDDGPIVVEIIPMTGGPAKRLVFAPAAALHTLFISNLPSHNGGDTQHAHAAGDDDVAALHFSAYYELLEHEPADRPLPRIAVAPATRKGSGMMRPVLCTPAWFEQQ
jgi:hypothetical protein